jgi:hypothetical protein
MVNNTNILRNLMSFGEDDFYMIQIIKRRKDNPEMKKGELLIKNFYVPSFEVFDELIPRILRTCEFENGRAYMRPHKRNYKKLGMIVLRHVANLISNNHNWLIQTAFDSMAGKHHSDPIKKWIIDVDRKDFDDDFPYEHVFLEVEKLVNSSGRDHKKIVKLPTKNGYHLITPPFNIEQFKNIYPFITVYKDGSTLLICP